MKYELNAREARVIGCLLEKTGHDTGSIPAFAECHYAGMQPKTNREPVMDLSESEVQQLLDLLLRKHFLRTLSGFGNRVVKYEQRFCNSEFGQLKLSPAELAVITLLLRGAQTPGELRTRTNRMHEFSDVSEVEQVLQQLATREDGPFVVRLAREPGKRESRFMHLFSGPIDEAPPAAFDAEDDGELSARVSALESEVAELKRQLQQLLARDAND
ncbi:DUF480 domain-containing protein [Serratia marcescens]|nr:DUF480 domain-containing protein [Serratia marcescens]